MTTLERLANRRARIAYLRFVPLLTLGPTEPAEPPAPDPFTIYWGRHVDPVLDEAAALTIPDYSVLGQTGHYTYPAGVGYFYFIIPNTRTLSVVRIGAFPVGLASSAPYTSVANGLNYMPLTILGVAHKVYRVFNQSAGQVVLSIS